MQDDFPISYGDVESEPDGEGAFSILYDQLVSPKTAVETLAYKQPFWLGFFVVAFAAVSSTTAGMIMGGDGSMGLNTSVFILACFAQTALMLILLVPAVGIYHFAATRERMLGNARVLFLLVCTALLPNIFLTPLAILCRAVPAGAGLYVLGFLLIVLWAFILKVLAIKNYYGISAFGSVLVVLLPYLLIALLTIPLFVMMIAGLSAALKGLVG